MSVATIPATTGQWPTDVLAFAVQHQVVDSDLLDGGELDADRQALQTPTI